MKWQVVPTGSTSRPQMIFYVTRDVMNAALKDLLSTTYQLHGPEDNTGKWAK